MKLLIALKNNRGFTLIEILVTMGLVGMLFVAGSFMDISSIGRELVISENTTLVSALQKARSRAMNNIYASPHGVYFGTDEAEYIVFRGASYDSDDVANEHIERNINVVVSAKDDNGNDFQEIYFEQLSGKPNIVGKITLDDGVQTPRVIDISENGLIAW